MRCIFTWGLSSALIRSLHKSIHALEMEINPPKRACGCPGGEVMKNGHASNPLTPWNAFVNVRQLPIPGDLRSV